MKVTYNKLILPVKISIIDELEIMDQYRGIGNIKEEDGVTVLYSGGSIGNKSLISIQANLGGKIVKETAEVD